MPHHNIDPNKFSALIKELNIPSIQQSIFIEESNREINIIRDDLIHSVISGNKWRKLNHHLNYFSEHEYRGISSMGGTYSNHLHALAFVCNQLNIDCTLFIYGWNGELNSPTLIDCKLWNASLTLITRQQAEIFRRQGIEGQQEMCQNYYWIPEGGGGLLGEHGMKQLVEELPEHFDLEENLIVCACGTGTSVQGILNHTKNCHIASMKIVNMANYPWINNKRIRMIYSGEAHSFAKRNQRLMNFIDYFKKRNDILLDPVYTGPLMFYLLESEDLLDYNKIYFVHTGGLQANRIK